MTERQFHIPKEMVHYQNLTDPDEVVVFDGDKYLRQHDRSEVVLFTIAQYREVARLRMHNREYGDYPWDHWEKWAREDGVPDDLVQLGRSLIREADQHSWSMQLQDECGWNDSGAKLLQFVLQQPDEARKRWEYLMRTDGERVDVDA